MVGRSAHAAAYDPGAERIVVFGGLGQQPLGDTWLLEGQPDARPGFYFSVDSQATGLERQQIRTVTAAATAGGSGTGADGAALHAWSWWRGEWGAIATTSAGPADPDELVWTISDASAIDEYLGPSGLLALRLSTTTATPARVLAVDHIEVTLDYEARD